MDMSKYKEMFLSEAKEHLACINQEILALESEPDNRERIDALFRAAHSIKGMAASMGYTQTAELSHHLEDVMDRARKGGNVSAPAVDRMLKGVDLLEGLIEDIESAREERAITAFTEEDSQSEPAVPRPTVAPSEPPANEKPPSVAIEPPSPGPDNALVLTVILDDKTIAPAARAFLLLHEIQKLGSLISSSPGEDEIRRGVSEKRLEFILQSDSAPGQLTSQLKSMPDIAQIQTRSRSADQPAKSPSPPPSQQPQTPKSLPATVRVRTELLDRFIDLTGELITSHYMLEDRWEQKHREDVSEGLGQLRRLITDLHHHVLKVRMMAFESITARLPRQVREQSHASGKEVAFRIEGQEVELDRAILEKLADPLMHMIRNAVDHGIDEKGQVLVRAFREKEFVIVEVADNGRGMDPVQLRKRAVSKGILSKEKARTLPDREALQLICIPGFSTASEVSETSGRGVGMDVVKSAVENLGGTLEILSRPGKGTQFRLKLPLSVAIIHILLVECADNLLGIPITRVYHTMDVSVSELRKQKGKLYLPLPREDEEDEEERVPLVSLRKILDLPAAPLKGSFPLVVTEIRGRRVGLVVDRLAGQQETFVKPLDFPLNRQSGISGATILGSGQIVFIIDPPFLLEKRATRTAVSRRGDAA